MQRNSSDISAAFEDAISLAEDFVQQLHALSNITWKREFDYDDGPVEHLRNLQTDLEDQCDALRVLIAQHLATQEEEEDNRVRMTRRLLQVA